MRLIKRLYSGLRNNKKVILYTDMPDERHFAPVLSFNVRSYDSEQVSAYLNKNYGIATRSGLHCCPMAHEFMQTEDIGTVRIVPSVFTTDAQINTVLYAISKIS